MIPLHLEVKPDFGFIIALIIVKESFYNLIAQAKFRYIFFGYNNEGLMPSEEIKEIMSRFGDYDLATRNYRHFKADKIENRNHKANNTKEYLHILEKK